ncbi:MAG: hypothetical protein AAGG02_13265 [Cyanobacteria bacterium P01_H01_bin.15]
MPEINQNKYFNLLLRFIASSARILLPEVGLRFIRGIRQQLEPESFVTLLVVLKVETLVLTAESTHSQQILDDVNLSGPQGA